MLTLLEYFFVGVVAGNIFVEIAVVIVKKMGESMTPLSLVGCFRCSRIVVIGMC